jgi:hypothetical protein
MIILSFFASRAQAVTSTLTAAETVANVNQGVNDQTANLASTTPNVLGDRASTTITVGSSIPASGATIVIGGCTITFQVAASSTAGLNCVSGAMNLDIGSGSYATTTANLAATLLGLANVRGSTASGTMLTVSASSTDSKSIVFTAATSSTLGAGKILFTPDAGNKITLAVSKPGTASVAEIDDVTIGGTIDTGDVFGLISTSTALNTAASYTVGAADTLQSIADKIRNQVWASSASTTVGFTVATTGTATIRLTARRAGYGNTVAGSATNYGGVSKIVTFTPAEVAANVNFQISINSRDYSYRTADSTLAGVIAGLVTAAAGDADVSCADTTEELTCTAKVAGTAFTYRTDVSFPVVSSSGGGGRTILNSEQAPVVRKNLVPVSKVEVFSAPIRLSRSLSLGQSHKEVKLLQEKLKSLGFIKKTQNTTNYFGIVTKQAVIKFQVANKIKPANGVLNVKTRLLLNSK